MIFELVYNVGMINTYGVLFFFMIENNFLISGGLLRFVKSNEENILRIGVSHFYCN